MNDQQKSPNIPDQAGFLLKEYETLRTFRQDLISLGDRRFNFFVAILSGAAIFLSWLSGQQNVNEITIWIIILGVLCLGLTTFARTVRRNSSIILYTRGMNRIRMYFLQHYPEIGDYLILVGYDDTPSFKTVSFSEQLPIMLALMNGMIAGASFSMLAISVFRWNITLTATTGFMIFAILLISQIRYYNLNMKKRVSSFEVKFPDNKA